MPPLRKLKRSAAVDDGTTAKKVKVQIESTSTPATVGRVLVTGTGDVGQLGLGSDVLEKSRPALVNLDHEIVGICAGGMHTVCLSKDGKVITFGCNDEGALGRNTSDEDAEFSPGVVVLPSQALQISAGDSHTAALLEDGRVFAWGTFRDSHGNMGLTLTGNERVPYEVPVEGLIDKIASGADHIVMLTQKGDVYTFGCAEQGQLGRTSQRASDRHYSRHGFAKFLEPTLLSFKPSLRLHFDNIWAGTYCTFLRAKNSADIYVFGLNNYNQIGLESLNTHYFPTLSNEFSKSRWKKLCSGQHHSLALAEDGKVYVIGRKEYGRLGLGDDCEDASCLKPIPSLEDVVDIACGTATSFAVTRKGDLYGWGMGTSGQLGTGEEDDCTVPTLIKSKQLQERSVLKVSSGGQHTVILAKDNEKSGEKVVVENGKQ